MVIVQSCQEFKNYTRVPCSYHEFVPCRAYIYIYIYICIYSLHVMVRKWCQPTSSFAVRPVVLVTVTNEARLLVVERRMIRMMCGIVSTIDKKKINIKINAKNDVMSLITMLFYALLSNIHFTVAIPCIPSIISLNPRSGGPIKYLPSV